MSDAYQNNDPNAKFLKKAKIVKRSVYISVCEKHGNRAPASAGKDKSNKIAVMKTAKTNKIVKFVVEAI